MTLGAFLDVAVRSLVTCVALLSGFGLMTLIERRLIARFQWRQGPNRVGPGGILQPAADGLKLLFKEQLMPADAKPFIFLLAPCISLTVALTSFAVIPLQTEPWKLGNYEIAPYIADLNVGVLFLLGVTSLGVYGIVLGGWASGNKYSLIGAIRSSAQMVSYELAMGTALLSPLLMVGSLSFVDIANYQKEHSWLVVPQFLAFVLFCISAIAETNRAPFDLPEAEQELGAGFHTEYSGMRFALFFMAEYTAMFTVSAVATTVFLGGPHMPFLPSSVIWFVAKIAFFMFVYIWLRATLPRFRYDQLMRIGWQALLPIGVLNLVITAVGVVLRWDHTAFGLAILTMVLGFYLVGKMNRVKRQELSHG
ncbi:MAG: NADH-quinone oxidoreductase subunit NuoH [Candidatus Eremiobacteraeota bacterium]|nr:NADH-quinone oxidoreductase subunit NuoH [Candidatus Eremiobacteraeota bacterium]